MAEPKIEPTIFEVADIMAQNKYGIDIVKATSPNGNQIVSPEALMAAKKNYYDDVPNMSLETLRRERNPDIIPQMTIQQLRTLSDELYLTMNPDELWNRYGHFLSNNLNFPQEINNPDRGTEYNPSLGRVFAVLWKIGGIKYSPTNLFDEYLRLNMDEHYQEWRENNERRYFETIYRALITPIPNGGGKRTRITKRRKTRKSRKNKRKTKRKTKRILT
jgi:hypothetical protein